MREAHLSVTETGDQRQESRDMAQLKKILLVDDDEDLREALSEQLSALPAVFE